MTRKITLALDTSVLNRLVKDANPEPFIAAILAGYSVCIPDMSFEEAVATRKQEVRTRLVSICRRLLTAGHCIMPAHWIMDLHVKQFHDNPKSYDWRQVNVQAKFIEDEIRSGNFAEDETLVESQATAMRKSQDVFESFFERSKRMTGIPTSFAEWLLESQLSGGSFWNTAALIYEGAYGSTSAIDTSSVLTAPPDEATLRSFLDACPPVKAAIYALELALYDRSLRPARISPAYKAGRNDLMMAVFLPYCDQFLSDDKGQLTTLREVASAADLRAQVRPYDEFCSGHLIR